jgi:hypothetical protein
MKTNVFVQFLYPFLHISFITFVIQMLKNELAESCLCREISSVEHKLWRKSVVLLKKNINNLKLK